MDTRGRTQTPMLIRRCAALVIAAIGAIHLALASDQFEESHYVGILFVAGAVGSFLVAIWLWIRPHVGIWTLGAVIAAGMFVGFILSRTVGLPNFKEAEWELSGIVSLVLEAAYIVAMAAWFAALNRRPARRPVARTGRPISPRV